MEYLHVEVNTSICPKRPGQPSGDVVRVARNPGWTTVICCDGMGSGIRANVAATLHASRLLELEKQGISLRDAFARVVGTIHEDRGNTPMYAAMAVARIPDGTMFTNAALMRPVDAKSSSSATVVADQNTVGDAIVNAATMTGAAATVAIPEIHKYAWR